MKPVFTSEKEPPEVSAEVMRRGWEFLERSKESKANDLTVAAFENDQKYRQER